MKYSCFDCQSIEDEEKAKKRKGKFVCEAKHALMNPIYYETDADVKCKLFKLKVEKEKEIQDIKDSKKPISKAFNLESYFDKKEVQSNFRVEAYLSKLNEFREIYPDAHFEIITRTANHTLSPSQELLVRFQNEKMSFEQYKILLLEEFRKNRERVEIALLKLEKIAKSKIVFLICFETSPRECHRSIVKEILDKKIIL